MDINPIVTSAFTSTVRNPMQSHVHDVLHGSRSLVAWSHTLQRDVQTVVEARRGAQTD